MFTRSNNLETINVPTKNTDMAVLLKQLKENIENSSMYQNFGEGQLKFGIDEFDTSSIHFNVYWFYHCQKNTTCNAKITCHMENDGKYTIKMTSQGDAFFTNIFLKKMMHKILENVEIVDKDNNPLLKERYPENFAIPVEDERFFFNEEEEETSPRRTFRR